MTDLALALDVGGTKVLGGLVTATGDVRTTRRATTAAPGGGDPGLRATLDVLVALRDDVPEHGTVVAVGAGFPEYVHDGELRSTEVLAWQEQPAPLIAAHVRGVPVVIESDVRCGAVAEARLGAGAGHPSVLYVSWGTGLSSTLVLDGVPLPGHRGEAIAAGELDVPARVDPTWSGNLEQYASGQAIARRYADSRPPTSTPPITGAHDVAALADNGDTTAASTLETAGEAVGTALAWLVAVLDPAAIVLGGGLGSADTVATRTAHATYRATVGRRPFPPPLVPAALGPTAGLIGAALLAHDRSHRSR